MRFSRDKRGFENTFVVHSERRRGKMRNRILYWFRTPPGVKVGRAALDDAAMQRIEAQHPHIEFDWPRILKGQGSPPSEVRPPAEVRRQRPAQGRETSSRQPGPRSENEPVTAGRAEAPTPPAREQARADVVAEVRVEIDTIIPAHARLGPEGVSRLRSRHREILRRIAELTEETRRSELKATAELLNPDSWSTDDEVRAGLEQYESVLAAVREAIGPRGRRRKDAAPVSEPIPSAEPAASVEAAAPVEPAPIEAGPPLEPLESPGTDAPPSDSGSRDL